MVRVAPQNNFFPDFVYRSGRQAINGFFGSFICGTHPIAGAIFAANLSEMRELIEPGIKQRFPDHPSLPIKVYHFVVSYLFSMMYSISISIALGFPISLFSAITLSIVMVPTHMCIDYIYRKHLA